MTRSFCYPARVTVSSLGRMSRVIDVAIGQWEAYSHNFPGGKYGRQAEESRSAIIRSMCFTASMPSHQNNNQSPLTKGWIAHGCSCGCKLEKERLPPRQRERPSAIFLGGAVFVFLLLQQPYLTSYFCYLAYYGLPSSA